MCPMAADTLAQHQLQIIVKPPSHFNATGRTIGRRSRRNCNSIYTIDLRGGETGARRTRVSENDSDVRRTLSDHLLNDLRAHVLTMDILSFICSVRC